MLTGGNLGLLSACRYGENVMPKIGDCQVNDADYEGRVVIEQYGRYNMGGPCWAVPAWEERGDVDMEGPFADRAEAAAALARAEEAWG
jgi:hypothetical protein